MSKASVHKLSLLHYSNRVVNVIRSAKQPVGTFCKPEGLWVSVKGEFGWEEWCRGEDFRVACLSHVHEVTLSKKAKILWLRTKKDLDDFTVKYGEQEKHQHAFRRYEISWKTVAKEYHGLIISPYIAERRLHTPTSWYYSWDCASGCIWRKSAIASIKLIEERHVTAIKATVDQPEYV